MRILLAHNFYQQPGGEDAVFYAEAALLDRDGHDCEECLTRKFKRPAIRHKCYRGSLSATSVLSASLAYHHWRGTFANDVDLYITPSEGVRKKFLEAGIKPEKIATKPH